MNNNIITNNRYDLSISPQIDITVLRDKFLLHTKRYKQLSTVQTYSKKLKVFVEWWRTALIQGSIKDTLGEYRLFLKERYKTAKSRNVMLSVVRSFYTWLFDNGLIDHNPIALLKNFKDDNAQGKNSLNKYQLHDLFKYLRSNTTRTGIRNRVMIILALQNGLRVNEIANIMIEDITTKEDDYIIRLLRKGNEDKSAYTILQPDIYELLREYIGQRTEGHLFNAATTYKPLTSDNISRIIKTTFRNIGIDDKRITAHSLRHTAAVTAYRAGATMHEIMKMLNHKNISTTQIYISSISRHENSAEKKVSFDY